MYLHLFLGKYKISYGWQFRVILSQDFNKIVT